MGEYRAKSRACATRAGERRLALPQLEQRPVFAQYRIAVRARYLRDRFERFGVFDLAAATKIVFASRRVSAHHQEILALHQTLVPGASWKHYDVPGSDVDVLALGTAEPQASTATR